METQQDDDLNLDALHAILIKLFSKYTEAPGPGYAIAIMRILECLDTHPQRPKLSNKYDPYKESLATWRNICLKTKARHKPADHRLN